MDRDFDIGNDIKDDIIPLALEYYLGVIEIEPHEHDEFGNDINSDEEEEEKPKPKKKGGKKEPAGGPQKGPNGEECKQQ